MASECDCALFVDKKVRSFCQMHSGSVGTFGRLTQFLSECETFLVTTAFKLSLWIMQARFSF